MNVLSLFDGISCGKVALERAALPVNNYYASEVDKYASIVSEKNHPTIHRLGDVQQWRDWDIPFCSIDLVLAGFPCQGFSLCGKQLAFDDPRSRLFFEVIDILNHIKSLNPNVKFLLENVPMKQEYLSAITDKIGVNPVLMNSNLVSGQNRRRYYWMNWEVGLPEDRGILTKDILEGNEEVTYVKNRGVWSSRENKTQCLDANYFKGVDNHGQRSMIKVSDNEYRKLTPIECERLQNLPDNYTEGVSNTQRYKMLGNGWTVDIISYILKCCNSFDKINGDFK